MSKGFNGVTDKEFQVKKYLRFKLTPKEWCSYPGICRINQLVTGEEHICDYCKYKKLVDIPDILDRLNNN
jgi:hypothetical protein